jgi:hypothetical protein
MSIRRSKSQLRSGLNPTTACRTHRLDGTQYSGLVKYVVYRAEHHAVRGGDCSPNLSLVAQDVLYTSSDRASGPLVASRRRSVKHLDQPTLVKFEAANKTGKSVSASRVA